MRRTIAKAIEMTLDEADRPLTPQEVYDVIIERDRYRFRADDPVHVVRSQLRRRCTNLDFPSAVDDARFKRFDRGRYGLSTWPDQIEPGRPSNGAAKALVEVADAPGKGAARRQLHDAHRVYLESLAERVLREVKELTPGDFEVFCAQLLKAYGLRDLETTPLSNDRGIDGTGTWDLGTGEIQVAFQCKRFGKRAVNPKDVQAFQGASTGRYHLGIFLTTTRFTARAQSEATRQGVLPIILVDGPGIVQIMLDNEFGVETADELPVYDLDLDTVLSLGKE